MAYLKKVICTTVPNNDELAAFFRKREILNPGTRISDATARSEASVRKVSRPLPAPTRSLFNIHLSSVVSFLSSIKYKFYVEKNYVHRDAIVETINHTRCYGLGTNGGIRNKPGTKVFVFTFVCKGTSLCRATPIDALTSKRRNCGYGTRLFTLNSSPDIVIIEEFGRHNDSLGSNDLGYQLVPPLSERLTFSIELELDVLRSLMRGLTPAKHLTYAAERRLLTKSHDIDEENYETEDVMKEVRKSYRRFHRLTHTNRDIDGVKNVLAYLQEKQDLFYVHVQHLEDYTNSHPLLVLIVSRPICETIRLYGKHILGLDATFNVCIYGFALFAVMGRSNAGALPFAYFISSSKSELAVSTGLLEFRRAVDLILFELDERAFGSQHVLDNFTSYSPQGICIDKDLSEASSIKVVFPNSLIILCHYHFMVIVIDEVRAERHGLGEEGIVNIMNSIRKLSAATTIESFKSCVEEIKHISVSFYEYFDKNFLNETWIDTFSEVNRQHLPLSVQRLCRSNMLCEVSFRTLKYVIFGGLQNKRLDDLIYTLAYRVFPYFQTRQKGVQCYSPRFLTSVSQKSQGTILFQSGHVSQVTDFVHNVLSGTGENLYTVISEYENGNLEQKCTCLAFAYSKNVCKHIYAVRIRMGQAKEVTEVVTDDMVCQIIMN